MKLVGVPAHEFPKWVDDLRWHFDSFAERNIEGRMAEDFRRMVLERDAQCWVVMDHGEVRACGLTQVHEAGRKWCEAIACAGEGSEAWSKLILGVAAWAKEKGCEEFRLFCRPGWERRLKDLGFRKTHVTLDMEL